MAMTSGLAASDMAALLGALGGITAAAFSGATLRISGAREERKWRRDVMLELLWRFLDASFAGQVAQRAVAAQRRGDDLAEFHAEVAESHQAQLDALTKLRLISPAEVIRAAEHLHGADHAVHAAALAASDVLSEEAWTALCQRQDRARERLIDSSRRAVGLDPGEPIRHE